MSGSDDYLRQAGDHWRRKGGRMTAVRQMICGTIASGADPFLAETLWEEVRKIDPCVSLTSVYRTLRDLVEGGLLREIHGPEKHRSFIRSQVAAPSRVFFICKDCHQVHPLGDVEISRRLLGVVSDYVIGPFHLAVHATCEAFGKCGVQDKCGGKDCGGGRLEPGSS